MCLLTSNTKPSVSSQGIKCIKVVRKCIGKDNNTEYTSLFDLHDIVKYNIGEITRMGDRYKFEAKPRSSWWYTGFVSKSSYSYYCGPGIHTFKPDAVKAWKNVYDWAKDEFKKGYPDIIGISVLECEIPAGIKYFEGISTCLSDNTILEYGYCSESVRVIREIESEIFTSKK